MKRPRKEKSLLIFDGGYYGGDVHVYEYKKTYPSKDIQEEMKAYYKNKLGAKWTELPDHMIPNIVRDWVGKKFGKALAFDINP